jgi:hypothetical protein
MARHSTISYATSGCTTTPGWPSVFGFTYSTPHGAVVGLPWCSPLITSPMRPIVRPIIAAAPPASMSFQTESFERRAQMYAPTMAPNRPPHWLIPPSVSAKMRRS